MTKRGNRSEAAPFSMIDPRIMDPQQEIVDRHALSGPEMDQVVAVMEAMNNWREKEREMSEHSRRYMRLGETDMRALRFLMAADRHGRVATPGAISENLGISAAATTKLLDRLSVAGHIQRVAHPTDRRSLAITVSESTRASARSSVGRSHARRFDAVARLSAEDRSAVLRFFDALMDSAQWLAPDEETAEAT